MIRLRPYIPLPVILLIGFFVNDISLWYYQTFERPQILQQSVGNVFYPDSYIPKYEAQRLSDYDFVIVQNTGDSSLVERFYSKEGNISDIKFINGKMKSTSIECVVRKRSGFYTYIGFIIFCFGTLLHSFRAKHLFCILGMSKNSADKMAIIPIIYGFSMFVFSILIPLAPCKSPI